MTLGEALLIVRGDPPARLRGLAQAIKADVDRYRAEGCDSNTKAQLRAFTPAAAFAHFHNLQHIRRFTGAVPLDFDDVDDPEAFRAEAAAVHAPGNREPSAVGVFVSPSWGVKLIAAVRPLPQSVEDYVTAYRATRELYEAALGVAVDPEPQQTPDRLCFFGSDPGAVVRWRPTETWGVPWR